MAGRGPIGGCRPTAGCGRVVRPDGSLTPAARRPRRFSDPRNPPCFGAARAIEEQRIAQWIQEAYDAHRDEK